MEPPFGRQWPSNQRQPPLNNPNKNPQRPPQTVASSSGTTSPRGKSPAQSSTPSPMSAENYAMDLQFEQVSRRRQGSANRALTIQTDSSSLPPISSSTLLRPSRPTTPNKCVASTTPPQDLQLCGIHPHIPRLYDQKSSSQDHQLLVVSPKQQWWI